MNKRTTWMIPLVLTLVLASAGPACAMTRIEVLERARRWVDLEVPYSQASYFEGWRQDCSGMASMSWDLDRSYSTRTLAPLGTRIHRDELQPGDMLLKYDYHAAIFYKWANADHTWYWTLEQSGSVGHAHSRLTLYPFWGVEGVYAYRRNGIEEVDDYGPYILEVAGGDRYGTAIAASRLAFPDGTATLAVVCSGQDWPDALGGSALAGALEGPVLLTPRDRLPSGLTDELLRLGVTDVVLVGGEAAVSPEVASAIDALPGVSVRRIGGRDRYETAALVASATVDALETAGRTYDGAVYVATGERFPDALGAAAVAAYTGRPILLAKLDGLPSMTASAVASLGSTTAYVAGGHGALGATVTVELSEAGILEIERFAGSDRYETSLMLARHGVEEGLVWDDVALATGEGFPDALAGAVMQARRGSTLVLTPPGRLAPCPDWAVREHSDVIERVTVLGGEGAIEPIVRRQLRWILDEP